MRRLSTWNDRFRTVLSLPREEVVALARATAVWVVVAAGLRVVSLPRLARALGIALAPATEHPAALGDVALDPRDHRRLHAAVRLSRLFRPRGRCLRRALITGRLLRHRSPALHLGVRRDDEHVHAHAWIEIEGRSLDDESAMFARLERSDRRRAP